ncbi:hypothetical protein EBR66_07475 [bacterium]|nr:hypothetical protein [bacterium]
MYLNSPLPSPLAEKRIIFSMIKKQMIGRRAYTDSMCNKIKHRVAIQGESPPNTPRSSSSIQQLIRAS